MVVGREECLLLLLILRASDTKESELDWHSKFGKSVEAYTWEGEPQLNKEEEFQTKFRSC